MKDKQAGLPEVETFYVDSGGIHIYGELYLPRDLYQDNLQEKPYIIFCHGIPAGDAKPARRKKGYHLWARFFSRKGYRVVFFNFRGTGESQGNLNLQGWSSDLITVLDWCREREGAGFPGAVLISFSAGAAVAVEVASEDSRVKAVATGACPGNFDFLFDRVGLEGVLAWMEFGGFFRDSDYPPDTEQWKEEFLSIRPENSISRISPRPLLLTHGEKDDWIPVEHARHLYRLAEDPKTIHVLGRAGHQLRNYPRVFQLILRWFFEQGL